MSLMEKLLESVEWNPVEKEVEDIHDDLPYVTHEGYLDFGKIKLKCYQLSNGRKIIDANDLDNFFKDVE